MLQRDNGHLKMVFHIKFGNSFVIVMTVDYHILETILEEEVSTVFYVLHGFVFGHGLLITWR